MPKYLVEVERICRVVFEVEAENEERAKTEAEMKSRLAFFHPSSCRATLSNDKAEHKATGLGHPGGPISYLRRNEADEGEDSD